MNVNFNSWHAKLYRFHYKMKHDCDLRTDYPWEANTNLCPYMRTVLFYWWLRYLFINGRIWKVPLPAVVIPALLIEAPLCAGVLNYNLKITILIVYAIFAGALLLIGLCGLINWTFKKVKKVHVGPQTTLAEATLDFWDLLGEYWDAIHNKICPSIKLVSK